MEDKKSRTIFLIMGILGIMMSIVAALATCWGAAYLSSHPEEWVRKGAHNSAAVLFMLYAGGFLGSIVSTLHGLGFVE